MSKKFGDMTAAEQRAAVKRAVGQLQAELTANADAIGKALIAPEIPADQPTTPEHIRNAVEATSNEPHCAGCGELIFQREPGIWDLVLVLQAPTDVCFIRDGEPDQAAYEARTPHRPHYCPDDCGCRLGTNDADRFECGCDGPCTG
ncbi:MAG: hypothetical protein ACRDRJ_10175 [Streptosporangiaceae bacterium]